MTKYRAAVQAVGELAGEFIAEGILVFFAVDAPEELRETALVHDCTDEPAAPVEIGDIIRLDRHSFPVLAVGRVANENLKNLGHLVLKFNGLTEAEMEGDVTLPAMPVPDLGIGSTLLIEDGEMNKRWN